MFPGTKFLILVIKPAVLVVGCPGTQSFQNDAKVLFLVPVCRQEPTEQYWSECQADV